ncbi:hypothetical protein HELRODRAFT_170800 [Helobdella robusta]|uniref:Uncharacterized protein n=1 Tax=Helobdella robusta TaxID=6412 RepID=T1F3F9_HELRO|nr:hypothetical protein HELRODRAFT_170800 [Helobdella robusta]ESO06782.1 hypothetical protein HELRODRAFT_170800 [Helobdella robusta]
MFLVRDNNHLLGSEEKNKQNMMFVNICLQSCVVSLYNTTKLAVASFDLAFELVSSDVRRTAYIQALYLDLLATKTVLPTPHHRTYVHIMYARAWRMIFFELRPTDSIRTRPSCNCARHGTFTNCANSTTKCPNKHIIKTSGLKTCVWFNELEWRRRIKFVSFYSC